MEELKAAVQAAQHFMLAMLPEVEAPRLEEVERDGEAWLITLSFEQRFLEERPRDPDSLRTYNVFGHRAYKRFRVEHGVVQSMTIRELSGA